MKRAALLIVLAYALLVGSAYAQTTAVSYTKLHYSRVEVLPSKDKLSVTLTVYYKDPSAKAFLTYLGSDYTDKITYLVAVPIQTVNINRQVLLLSPLKGDTLNLYFAVYWSKASMDAPMLCISVEPIAVNWYVIETL